MSAPNVPASFKHIGPPAPLPVNESEFEHLVSFDASNPFASQLALRAHPEFEKAQDAYQEAQLQWETTNKLLRETQWRYFYADTMLAARGEQGRVDDIAQVAQTILPALLQAHAMRPGSDDEPLSDDLFGDAQINGWGSEGNETYYQDDEKAEPQTLAENLAFDAFVLAEAFLNVRRRRYGA